VSSRQCGSSPNTLGWLKKEHICQLQDELPPHFTVLATHHDIVTADQDSTALYVAALAEIYIEVHDCLQRPGLSPAQPKFPLITIIFRDAEPFRHYSDRDQMKWSEEFSEACSTKSNRIVVLERHKQQPSSNIAERQILTAATAHHNRSTSDTALQQLPRSTRTTLIHEACHQIGFNCEVHSQLAQGPQWLVEGLALLLKADTILTHHTNRALTPSAYINPERLYWFHNQYLPRYAPRDLAWVISSDDLFSQQSPDAYSLA